GGGGGGGTVGGWRGGTERGGASLPARSRGESARRSGPPGRAHSSTATPPSSSPWSSRAPRATSTARRGAPPIRAYAWSSPRSRVRAPLNPSGTAAASTTITAASRSRARRGRLRPRHRVELEDLLRRTLPRIGAHALEPAPPQLGARFRLGQHAPDGVGELLGVARLDQQRGVAHHLRDRAAGRRDDRRAARHRLERRQAEPLELRREDERARVAIELDEVVVADVAGEAHVVGEAELLRPRLEAALLRIADAGEHELRRAARPRADPRERGEQHVERLLAARRPDEEQV